VRRLYASIRLGLERELGWGFPPLVIVVNAVPNIASVLTVVMVYWVGAGTVGAADPGLLSSLIIGASIYTHFASYIWAPISAVAEGKASYTYPLVFIANSALPYISGRVIASFVESSLAAVLALVSSTVATASLVTTPNLSLTPQGVALLLLCMTIGLLPALGMGLLLASYAIFVTRLEWGLPVYIAGLLMLLSDSIVPVSILPYSLQLVAESLPFTHVVRAARAALIGPAAALEGEAILASILGLIWLFSGLLVYSYSERRGRERGYIDAKVT